MATPARSQPPPSRSSRRSTRSASGTATPSDLRAWFKALYEILLGQTEGPRFGTFVAFYGPAETAALIRQVLGGRRIDQPAA